MVGRQTRESGMRQLLGQSPGRPCSSRHHPGESGGANRAVFLPGTAPTRRVPNSREEMSPRCHLRAPTNTPGGSEAGVGEGRDVPGSGAPPEDPRGCFSPPPPDLYTAPDSCEGRCGEPPSEEDECHCHPECGTRGSCCGDFDRHCRPGGDGDEDEDEEAAPARGVRWVPDDPPQPLLPLPTGGFSRSSDSITEQELLELSEQLYGLDHNRARPGDIALNPQHRAGPGETGHGRDLSPQPLYKHVNEELFSKPTYSSFIKLLDNYQRATGREEEVTAEELREQDTFLGEAMETELMRTLFTFLREKNRYGSEQEFLEDLKGMWFGLYSRGDGEQDSSGFEHVFSGEVKKGKVSGFHNWIRFYLLEKQGTVNYLSHNFDGPWDTFPTVLGLQFSWDGFHKEVGSAFIGSSPEFELGLYTLCFLARPGRA
ncbi:poly(U)-specific endoribonuclease-like [Corapipo altera]|uniref:poly(U)-specific endoribonuclease-like n=1 Tax=Corapipo altera TaxID=415028 RepID=UPI000FD6A179|nr:poly(U)-specific endoribonuclease-like [Corapipo altera]